MRKALAVVLLTLAAGAGAAPAPEPMYTVELCCDLCPLAANRAAYNTPALQSFKVLLQGEENWLFRTDDDLATGGPGADGIDGLKRLGGALKQRGVDLVLAYPPTRGLMHADRLPRAAHERFKTDAARASYDATLSRFRGAGLSVPDMNPVLQGGDAEPFYFRGDHHWTPQGARLMARAVADAVKGLPAYATLPKKTFVTSRVGMLAKQGSLQRAASQLCGFGYPEQYVEQFTTAAEGDPLGEATAPQVVLLGTGNSDPAYNFTGFLSEFLGVDIQNESVDSGGFSAAIQRYLGSAAFRSAPPKILILELEPNQKLANKTFFRQVVPLVNDGCSNRPAILKGQAVLRTTSTEVLFNGSGEVRPLRSRNHVIDLRFSDPAVRELQATIWYTNGSKESFRMDSSENIAGGGRFVFELRSEAGWGDRTFLSLDLTRPASAPAGANVDARLCARSDAAAPAKSARKRKSGSKKLG